jgi:isoaspartyl peptidase/L-asparaginase-like protein (Ntn-hydrolase superfamily)
MSNATLRILVTGAGRHAILKTPDMDVSFTMNDGESPEEAIERAIADEQERARIMVARTLRWRAALNATKA